MSAFACGSKPKGCVCGPDCEMPCWQRVGLEEEPIRCCCVGREQRKRKPAHTNAKGEFICEACSNGEHRGAIHAPGICDCTCRK